MVLVIECIPARNMKRKQPARDDDNKDRVIDGDGFWLCAKHWDIDHI